MKPKEFIAPASTRKRQTLIGDASLKRSKRPAFSLSILTGRGSYAIANPVEGPAVLAYNILDNGELELLNFQLIPDGRAAHISAHPSGKFLLTAQYRGGSEV